MDLKGFNENTYVDAQGHLIDMTNLRICRPACGRIEYCLPDRHIARWKSMLRWTAAGGNPIVNYHLQ